MIGHTVREPSLHYGNSLSNDTLILMYYHLLHYCDQTVNGIDNGILYRPKDTIILCATTRGYKGKDIVSPRRIAFCFLSLIYQDVANNLAFS